MRFSYIIFSALIFISILSCSPSSKDTANIRLGYLQSDLHHLPAFVAIEKGFFKQQGLAVEIVGAFRAGPELMSAFAAGELDIGYVGLAPAITAAANNTARIRCIAQVNTEGSALVVGKNSPYNTIADLKGKVITIPGYSTMQDFLLRKALNTTGLDVKQIKILVLKPPEMIPALTEQDIDAFIAWEPYPSKAVNENTGKILLSSHQIWEDHPCCVVVADEQLAKTRSADIEKIIAVHNLACRFINDHQVQAIDIGVKYTGMDRKTVEAALGYIKYDGVLNLQRVSEYIDFLKELRYIKPDTSEKILMSLFNQ
jgi:NitT/TauT family transport system substrate-binding protein